MIFLQFQNKEENQGFESAFKILKRQLHANEYFFQLIFESNNKSQSQLEKENFLKNTENAQLREAEKLFHAKEFEQAAGLFLSLSMELPDNHLIIERLEVCEQELAFEQYTQDGKRFFDNGIYNLSSFF